MEENGGGRFVCEVVRNDMAAEAPVQFLQRNSLRHASSGVYLKLEVLIVVVVPLMKSGAMAGRASAYAGPAHMQGQRISSRLVAMKGSRSMKSEANDCKGRIESQKSILRDAEANLSVSLRVRVDRSGRNARQKESGINTNIQVAKPHEQEENAL